MPKAKETPFLKRKKKPSFPKKTLLLCCFFFLPPFSPCFNKNIEIVCKVGDTIFETFNKGRFILHFSCSRMFLITVQIHKKISIVFANSDLFKILGIL